MYKPAFWLFLLLQTTVLVSAQPNKALRDTLFSTVEPAVKNGSENSRVKVTGTPSPVALRTVPKRLVDSLKEAEAFWYANAAPLKQKEKQASATGASLFQKRWFRNLLWVLILGSFLGVLFWYLVSSNLFIFRKKVAPLSREAEVEESGDDLFSIDYEKGLSEATARGQYRLAVRLWYLQTLKILAEKDLIHYRHGTTNQDYVAQLNRHGAFRDFFRLTRHFEYTWYGQFSLSAEAYERIKADFLQFQKGLR